MADGSRVRRRILHTSDVHLISLGDRACHSLRAVVDAAVKNEVDLVIIAGDLFDGNSVDEELASFAVEQLRHLPAYTVILPGNHDCLVADSIYHRGGLDDLWRSTPKIRIFRAPQGETLDFPDLGVSVWGKPVSSYDGHVRPLDGIPRYKRDGKWHIAVAHGFYGGTRGSFQRSFPISHEEIVDLHKHNIDYVALGHTAAFKRIYDGAVKAYYCDSPTISGTVNIVDLAGETGVEVTRYSLWDKEHDMLRTI